MEGMAAREGKAAREAAAGAEGVGTASRGSTSHGREGSLNVILEQVSHRPPMTLLHTIGDLALATPVASSSSASSMT